MKSFSLLALALCGTASARIQEQRQLETLDFLGDNPDPNVVTYPLTECQGV